MTVEKLEFATRLPLSSWSGVGTLTAALVAAGDDSAARQAALDTVPEEYKWTEADVNRLVNVVDANADELTGALSSINTIVGQTANVTLETLKAETDALNLLLTSSDPTLDTVQERVDRINQIISDAESLAIADVAGLDTALAGKEPTGVAQSLVDAAQATFNTQIATLQGLIDSINLTLTTDNAAFDTAQERLNELIRLSNLLNGLAISSISGLQAVLDGFTSSISSIENRLYSLENAVQVQNTVAPVISGIGYTGQTLTAVAGTWSGGTPSGQWFANGEAINGETGLAYVVTAANNGARFTYIETVSEVSQASNDIYHWTPAFDTESNASVWFDVSDLSTVTIGGASEVLQLDDLHGGYSFAQASQANQPALNVAGALPSIDFDADDFLQNTDIMQDVVNGGSYTLIAVAEPTSSSNYILQQSSGSTNSKLHYGIRNASTITLAHFNDDADFSHTVLYENTIYASRSKLPGSDLHINGELIGVSANPANSLVGTSALNLGGNDSEAWRGGLSELFIINGSISDALLMKYEGYLGHKHGRSLHSGHAYEGEPPLVVATNPVISGIGYTGQTLTAVAGISINGSTPSGQWFADGVAISGETGLTLLVSYLYNGALFTYVETVDGTTKTSNEIHHWTPADTITSVWLDAADASTITLDGSNLISQWDDKSGNARNLTQSVQADQSTYDSNNAVSGGLPAVVGGQGTAWDGIPSFTKGEIIIVTAYVDGVENTFFNYPFIIGGSLANGNNTILGNVNTANWFPAGATVLSGESFINGSSAGSSTVLPLPLSVLRFDFSDEADIAYLLHSPVNAARGWDGPVCELIVLPTALSATDRNNFEAYLAFKNNIALAAGHAYENAPPTVGA